MLEDLDYYCVDNMPVALMPRFAELCMATKGRYERVALVTDVREKDGFDELLKTLDQLNEMDCNCRILYMDADEATLVKRYKESRRRHPLQSRGMSVEEAIAREQTLLAPVRERADFIVNSPPHAGHAAKPPLLPFCRGGAQARDRRDGDELWV